MKGETQKQAEKSEKRERNTRRGRDTQKNHVEKPEEDTSRNLETPRETRRQKRKFG